MQSSATAPQHCEPASAPMTTDIDESRAEIIEQIFSKLEAESERRAEEEAAAERQAAIRERERRRGSITISRFGQGQTSPVPLSASASRAGSPAADPLRTPAPAVLERSPFFAARKPAFYRLCNGAAPSTAAGQDSVDSFASASDPVPRADEDAAVHATQVATIVGKPTLSASIGRAIARRLSLTKSAPPTPAPAMTVFASQQPLVIGVSVQSTRTTVSVRTSDASGRSRSGSRSGSGAERIEEEVSAVVFAEERERERARGEDWWRGKARDLAQRFRRRSSAALLQSAQVATAVVQ
ncbi:hypothetical protein CERSUDRAFT_119482 [Gelatoporia subvermispora B]|uniref:Uncharacterized protein n=1 Tax=Ceriporiopsis subvermispora (strain B) TaxID=914234 RepID=M2QHU9_CERS8|nr:hypothetical protein CERSUDRAFT_119482 [Gelatoporia subvermispora B]